MSREKRKFVRVYYVDLKRDYPEVWYDPTCRSTWLGLLVGSDEDWPSIPELPSAVRRADLEKLTGCGLVEVLPGRRYVLKGYQVEREERHAKARKAAAASHGSNRSADA